jgi:hypothetical protein
VDTPGTEDTDGPELDLANCCMITEAIRVAKNVIPVIVISYYTLCEGKSESFRKIIRLLTKFIKNIEGYLSQLLFFFSHCPYEDDEKNKQ